MNEFMDNYRERHQFLYAENFPLKKKKNLVFITLPPVQTHYPNPRRIRYCKKTKANMRSKKYQPINSFSIPFPNMKNEFNVYGYNEFFHTEKFDIVKEERHGVLDMASKINWMEYKSVPMEMKKRELDKKMREIGIDKEAERRKEKRKKRIEFLKNERMNKLKKMKENKYFYKNEKGVEKASKLFSKYFFIWKAKREYKSLAKKRKQRMNICKELWKTEEDFVNNLKVLKEVYIDPFRKLSKKSRFFTDNDFKQIFSGLVPIIGLNEDFAKELQRSIFTEKGDFNHHCTISQKIIKISPFLKIYQTYCSKYQKTFEYLDRLRKSKKFSDMLEKMDKNPKTTKLGLSSYLILPIQRVPRYKLLLRDMLKNTLTEHIDYDGLSTSIKAIESTADYLNNAMKEIEQAEKVISIQRKFVDNKKCTIHQTYRRFVKEDCLYKGKIKGKDPIYLHLFNDVLIFSTKNKNNMFDYKFEMNLLNIRLFYCNEILRRKNLKINELVLTCKNKDHRDDWLMALLNTINEVKEKKKKLKLSSSKTLNSGKSSTVDVAIYDEKLMEFDMSIDDCILHCKNETNPTTKWKYISKKNILVKTKLKKFSHLRKFLISQDETKLQWGSPNKPLTESFIKLRDVKELVLGQNTLAFKRNPQPTAEHTSLSLLYGDGEVDIKGNWTGKTLDLIYTNKRDYEIWKRALRFLLADRGRTTHKRNKDAFKKRAMSPDTIKFLQINVKEEIEKDKAKFKEGGDSYTWGEASNGCLGHGDEKDEYGDEKDLYNPKVVLHLLYLNVIEMELGHYASAAILSKGRVVSWGDNSSGKLGHGDFDSYNIPSPIIAFKKLNIKKVQIGNFHSLFLDDDGNIWGCGQNQFGQLASCKEKKINSPKIILDRKQFPNIIDIGTGDHHCGAINSKGELFTWGGGNDGQLGHGEKEKMRKIPKKVEGGLKGKKVIQIAFGCWHSLALIDTGRVYSWGEKSFGQLGVPSKKDSTFYTPVLIPNLRNIVQIACGQSHCVAITKHGYCYQWGGGNWGSHKVNYVPVKVTSLCSGESVIPLKELGNSYRFKQISCGANHCLALVEATILGAKTRKVFAWGGGTYGRLGLGSEKDKHVPTEVTFFSNKTELRRVVAGGSMSGCICAHQWVPDEDVQECMGKCKKKFTSYHRRHHCRNCGGIFCKNCSTKKLILLKYGLANKQRVCDNCYLILKQIS